MNGICLLSQVMWSDSINIKFKYDDKVFDLMNTTFYFKLLVADAASDGGFNSLDGEAYRPKDYVYKKLMVY